MPSPDFIGIGAPKAATTWLFEILNIHPNIWMPPTKELHFFNQQNDQYSHFGQILFRQKDYHKSVNRFKYTPLKKVNWAYKYLLKKRTLQNYLDLFTPDNNQIAGELTPLYGTLELEKIAAIYPSLSKTKLIYILRNPIYRDWSSTCMSYKNHIKDEIDSIPIEELIKKATNSKRVAHSKYVENIARWQQYFASDQIFIGFFDEIQQHPYDFINRLFDFLGIPQLEISEFDAFVNKKVNSFSKAIPEKILSAIAKNEYQNIVNIHEAFNNQYTAAWLKEAKSILEK